MATSELPAPAELLPHGPEALYLDAATEFVPGQRAAAQLKIRPSLILYDNEVKGIPAWGGIEIMAQALGIYVGMDARSRGETQPRPGYLAAVRHFRATRPVLADGLDLAIEADCRHCEAHGLATFDCRIRDATTTLVSATLSIWRPAAGEAGA